MTLYQWAVFAFLTIVLAMQFGLPGQLGRAMCAVAWLVMFLLLLGVFR